MIIGLFIVGIDLRLNHYFGNRSLRLDEAPAALNLRDRSFPKLLHLNYDVLAPYSLLFIEKDAALLLGYTEYALRLFPLLAGIFALFMFYRFGIKTIGRSAAAIGRECALNGC